MERQGASGRSSVRFGVSQGLPPPASVEAGTRSFQEPAPPRGGRASRSVWKLEEKGVRGGGPSRELASPPRSAASLLGDSGPVTLCKKAFY